MCPYAREYNNEPHRNVCKGYSRNLYRLRSLPHTTLPTTTFGPEFADSSRCRIHSYRVGGSHSACPFNIIMGDKVCDSVNCQEDITIHQTTQQNITVAYAGDVGVTLFSVPYHGWGNVYVPVGWDGQVLRHELGHSLGLRHTEAGTIMCANVDCASQSITCADVNQYLTLRGYDPLVCY